MVTRIAWKYYRLFSVINIMGFRQHNDEKRQQNLVFHLWLAANKENILRTGLPSSVLESRDDWAYCLYFGYHDQGNWNTPPFTCIDCMRDELSHEQKAIIQALETNWDEYVRSYPILAKRIKGQKLG